MLTDYQPKFLSDLFIHLMQSKLFSLKIFYMTLLVCLPVDLPSSICHVILYYISDKTELD